jgi:hypothetical protein
MSGLQRSIKSQTILRLCSSPGSKPLLSWRTNLSFSGEMNSSSMPASPGLSCEAIYLQYEQLCSLKCRVQLTVFSTPNAWLISDDLPTPVYQRHVVNIGLRTEKVRYLSYHENSEPWECQPQEWRVMIILTHRGHFRNTSEVVGRSSVPLLEEIDSSAC